MELTAMFERVAELLLGASYLLVGAGAGMSVDSQLPTYASASEGLVFFERNPHLTYRDLAAPDLLVTNPQRYYAWCAATIDQYRHTEPHLGYAILLSWCRELFSDTEASRALRHRMGGQQQQQPSPATSLQQGFFILTTNVDGFFERSGFPAESLCETHGSYWRWQCGGLRRSPDLSCSDLPPFVRFEKPCTTRVWRWTDEHRIEYSLDDMEAPAHRTHRAPGSAVCSFVYNHPNCPGCGLPARPNVYQFGDCCYLPDEAQEGNLANWCHSVERELASSSETAAVSPSAPKLVMLEFGVGLRVPKIRVHFERISQRHPHAAVLIRINPEASSVLVENVGQLIEVPCGAKQFLEGVNACLVELRARQQQQ